MFIEKCKSDCVESVSNALNKGSRWRARLSTQYNDPRNGTASRKLAALAVDAPTLSDSYWAILAPHFNGNPVHWRDCLSLAVRQVVFVHNTTSFPFFVRSLIGHLAGPVASETRPVAA
jgi:hypothetical protein